MMRYLKKFKHLLEAELKDVEVPDYVILTYAVCACDEDACGWGGWMIEAAFKETDRKDWPTGTGDKYVMSNNEQRCPTCGRETYRTSAQIVLDSPKPLLDENEGQYEIEPIVYEDEETAE